MHPPVTEITSNISLCLCSGCQGLVRFFALLRIKPHTPPLVRAPVNSFEFHTCVHTPQAGRSHCVSFGTEVLPPTPAPHRLGRGLLRVSKSYLLPTLSCLSVSYRQGGRLRHWCSSTSLRILPLHVEFHRPLLSSSIPVSKAVQVEPVPFTSDLICRLRTLYAQSFRITLATYVLPRLLARSQP